MVSYNIKNFGPGNVNKTKSAVNIKFCGSYNIKNFRAEIVDFVVAVYNIKKLRARSGATGFGS